MGMSTKVSRLKSTCRHVQGSRTKGANGSLLTEVGSGRLKLAHGRELVKVSRLKPTSIIRMVLV